MDAKLTGDVGIIRQYMELTYPKMMAALITIVVAIVLISLKDCRLSLIFACMGLLQLLPGIVYEKWTRKVYMNTMANEEAYTDWMLEGLKGIRTIKSYMQEKWFLGKFADKCSDMIDAGKKENQTAAVEDIISEFIKTVLTYGSYVVLGIFALKFGLSVVEIPVLIVLASTLFSGIDAIVHAWVGRARFNEAINRIGEIKEEISNDNTGGFTY
ncbi:MAG: ABC transporter ATP-binding protein [Lachnospiraceae bacterium]|nr:ABC transporter ATP-binding protein [Lachnospiraceae bacterium]